MIVCLGNFFFSYFKIGIGLFRVGIIHQNHEILGILVREVNVDSMKVN